MGAMSRRRAGGGSDRAVGAAPPVGERRRDRVSQRQRLIARAGCSMMLGRPANGALVSRVSALWLCGACVLLALGASPANAATDQAQAAAGPVCCFKLS